MLPKTRISNNTGSPNSPTLITFLPTMCHLQSKTIFWPLPLDYKMIIFWELLEAHSLQICTFLLTFKTDCLCNLKACAFLWIEELGRYSSERHHAFKFLAKIFNVIWRRVPVDRRSGCQLWYWTFSYSTLCEYSPFTFIEVDTFQFV